MPVQADAAGTAMSLTAASAQEVRAYCSRVGNDDRVPPLPDSLIPAARRIFNTPTDQSDSYVQASTSARYIHRDVSSKAGSVWDASPGCPGLETVLPVMLTEGHHKRGISLKRIGALTATNAANAMGLSHANKNSVGALCTSLSDMPPTLDTGLAIWRGQKTRRC
ncbi:MAG: hypothetical protein PSV22_05665 [Pseudolabrys sp.]|nr:hypothetical protein [Pseudolabrys sp.]